MNFGRWVDPRVASARLDDVRRYFSKRGWKPVPNAPHYLLRFEKPVPGRKKPIYQMVTSVEDTDDYPFRMTELIIWFSELEDRHPVEVLNDMLQPAEAADGPTNSGPGRRRGAKHLR
jgi:hypothetical protein